MPKPISTSRLRRAMEVAGLDGARLAEATGMHATTIWRIRSGRITPRASSIRKLAAALAVDVEYLYDEASGARSYSRSPDIVAHLDEKLPLPVTDEALGLSRGVRILNYLATRPGGAMLDEIALYAGVPEQSVFRLAETLRHERLVSRINDHYIPARKWLEFLVSPTRQRIVEAARHVLPEFARTSRFVVQLSILQGLEVVFIFRIGDHADKADIGRTVGEKCPAYATAAGKVLLVHHGYSAKNIAKEHGKLRRSTDRTIVDVKALDHELDETRERRWALDDEELNIGFGCIAVPVFAPRNEHREQDSAPTVEVALSITGIIADIRKGLETGLPETLIEYADRVTQRLQEHG